MPGRVALIGAEFEENLSIRYLAAAVQQDGVEAVLFPFNQPADASSIVRKKSARSRSLSDLSIP